MMALATAFAEVVGERAGDLPERPGDVQHHRYRGDVGAYFVGAHRRLQFVAEVDRRADGDVARAALVVVAGGDGQRRGQRAVYRGAVFAGASLQLFQLRAVQLPVEQAGTPRFQRHRVARLDPARAVAADQRFVLGGLLGQARRAFVAGEAAWTQILRRRQGAGGPGLRGGVGGQGQPLFGEGQHGSAVGDDVRYHDQQVVGAGVGGDRHGTDQWPAVRIDAFRQFALVDFPQPLLLAAAAHLAQRDGPLAGNPARIEPGIVFDPRAQQRMPRLQRVKAAAQVVDGQPAMDPHPGNHVQRGELVAEPVPAFHRGQRASYLGHHSTPGKVSASSFCRAKVRSGAKRK